MTPDSGWHDPPRVKQLLLELTAETLRDIFLVALGESRANATISYFVDAFSCFLSTSDRARLFVLSDPRAAIWAERVQAGIAAYGLSYLTSFEGEQRLREFGKFALGACVVDNTPCCITCSADSRAVLVVPGAKYAFVLDHAHAEVEVRHTAHGVLSADENRALRFNRTFVEAYEIVYPEDAFTPPSQLNTVLPRAEVEENDWMSAIRHSGKLIKASASEHALCACFGSVLVPIKDERPSTHCSVSFGSIPGGIFLSWCPDFRVIAEAIVHESDHQLIYVLTRHHAFWADDARAQAAVFRSPWRDDPRPLDGLLRGASAFARVAGFWAAVAKGEPLTSGCAEWAGGQATLAAEQSLDAVDVILRHGRLTEAGAQVVKDISTHAKEALNALKHLTGSELWFAASASKRNEHDRAWHFVNSGGKRSDVALMPDPSRHPPHS